MKAGVAAFEHALGGLEAHWLRWVFRGAHARFVRVEELSECWDACRTTVTCARWSLTGTADRPSTGEPAWQTIFQKKVRPIDPGSACWNHTRCSIGPTSSMSRR